MLKPRAPRVENVLRSGWGDFQNRSSLWRSQLAPWLLEVVRDRYLWALLIIALIVNLGLFGYLILEFSANPPVLPPLVPLHFDALGQPDRIEPRESLFSIAQIGLIVILGNLGLGAFIYRNERLASYILGVTSIVIQLLLWFAAIQILRFVAL